MVSRISSSSNRTRGRPGIRTRDERTRDEGGQVTLDETTSSRTDGWNARTTSSSTMSYRAGADLAGTHRAKGEYSSFPSPSQNSPPSCWSLGRSHAGYNEIAQEEWTKAWQGVEPRIASGHRVTDWMVMGRRRSRVLEKEKEGKTPRNLVESARTTGRPYLRPTPAIPPARPLCNGGQEC